MLPVPKVVWAGPRGAGIARSGVAEGITMKHILFLLVLMPACLAASWYNTTWLVSIPIQINSTAASSLTNFPARVSIDTSQGNALYTPYWSAGCSNVRFTLNDNTTVLKYQVDENSSYSCLNATNNATFWVGIPTLTGGANITIYAYVANSSVVASGEDSTLWADADYIHVYHASNLSDSVATVGATLTASTGATINSTTNAQAGFGTCFGLSQSTTARHFYNTTDTSLYGSTTYTVSGWARLDTPNSGGTYNQRDMFGAYSANYSGCMEHDQLAQKVIGYHETNNYTNLTWTRDKTGVWGYYANSVNGNTRAVYANATTNSSSNGDVNFGVGTDIGICTGNGWSWSRYSAGQIDEVRWRNATSTSDWLLAEFQQKTLVGVASDQPPGIGGDVLTPNPAYYNTNIRYRAFCSDPDNASLFINWTFTKNGVAVHTYDSQTSCSNFSWCNSPYATEAKLKGDNWTGSAICFDGILYSSGWVTSPVLTISNTAPTTGTPVITPASPVIGNQLNCSETCTDKDVADDTLLKSNFTWYIYTIPVNAYDVQVTGTHNNSAIYTTKNMSGTLVAGTNWTCSAICYDGTAYSTAWKNSTRADVPFSDIVFNMTKNMTTSSFNNLTNTSGCVINLTVNVANGSTSTVNTCSAAGSSYVNTTYDYCQTTCNTTGMSACTYNPTTLTFGGSISNTTYPCNLGITGYGTTEIFNLTKVMAQSAFTNQTVGTACTINLDVSVTNASQNYSHTCSAGGTYDEDITYDYAQIGCETQALAACSHDEDLAFDEDVVDGVYPCDINITGYDTVETFNLTKAMTDSVFNNLTTGTACEINMTVTVANGSTTVAHTCSAGGSSDIDTTYDYCQTDFSTAGLAACTHTVELDTGENLTDSVYPCDIFVNRTVCSGNGTNCTNVTNNITVGGGGGIVIPPNALVPAENLTYLIEGTAFLSIMLLGLAFYYRKGGQNV